MFSITLYIFLQEPHLNQASLRFIHLMSLQGRAMLQCFGSQEKRLHDPAPPTCPLQVLKYRGKSIVFHQKYAVAKQGIKPPCPTNTFPKHFSNNQMRINLLLQVNQKLQK